MWKRIMLTLTAAALLTTGLAGCGSESDQITVNEQGQNVISIMTASYAVQPASDDAAENPIIAEVEKRLNTDIKIKFAASANYGEKVTAAMGADTYPNIMRVPDRTSAIIQNCRGGTFWDVTDYIKKTDPSCVTAENPEGYLYPNLAKANDEVLHNMSVDGRVYGLYSSRALGRNGGTIRKDWLKNIGYDHYPQTLDEFYDVCEKFTLNDPDGNGVDDTYGMIMSSYTAPISQVVIWAGAPNGYGIEDGKLKPAFMYDEYLKGLTLLRDMHAKGYINQNWATMDPEKWNEPMLNHRGGIILDVVDRARRVQNNMLTQDPPKKDVIGVFAAVAPDENSERRVLPTTGFNGFYVFPKASVRTEEELHICLKFMNDLESPEIADLLQKGIEGRHYEIKDGVYTKFKDENGKDITTYDGEFADFNQLLTFINGESNLNVPFVHPTAEEVDAVQKDNENYTIANPAAPYISKTASLQGSALDDIINEANTKYIKGDIDEAGWRAAIEEWKKKGGEKVIAELNEAYQREQEKKASLGVVTEATEAPAATEAAQ